MPFNRMVKSLIGKTPNIAGIAAAFVILNTLDYVSTQQVLSAGGAEYNPLIHGVGLENLAGFKLAVTAGGLALAQATGRWDMLQLLNLALGVTVAGNFAAVAVAPPQYF